MKIVRKQIKRITLFSTAAALVLLVVFLGLFWTSPDLDYLLVIVFTIGVGPSSITGILHNRWKNQIERAMPELLRDLATSIRTGMPIQAALEHAANRAYGPLTDELKRLVAHMSWGMSFEEALKELSGQIDLPLVEKGTLLILEAGRRGGDLSYIFNSTASYMENMNAWNLRRRTQTLPYVGIFYFSVVIFLFIIILISRVIFVPITEMSQTGVPLLRPILTQAQARRVFLHTALFEAFFGGLLAGKINEASYISGLKHAMVLALVSGCAFFLFFR